MPKGLGRYAYGRHCKRVRIKGHGTRCHCNGKFAPASSCRSQAVSKKSTDKRNRRRRRK